MGASGWDYYVPFQADLAGALRDLQAQVFERGEFEWHGEWQPERGLIPATLEQLWQDESARESGTHSIASMAEALRAYHAVTTDDVDRGDTP